VALAKATKVRNMLRRECNVSMIFSKDKWVNGITLRVSPRKFVATLSLRTKCGEVVVLLWRAKYGV
jgi:hypothetical protein